MEVNRLRIACLIGALATGCTVGEPSGEAELEFTTNAAFGENGGGVLRIYMARGPVGSDSNDGTESSPMRTLQAIHDRLDEAAPDRDVEIHVSADEHTNQAVVWSYYHPDHSISFVPWGWSPNDTSPPPIHQRPTFNGNGPGYTRHRMFFFFDQRDATQGADTNLHFYYFHIKNYVAAGISFAGNRTNPHGSIARNRIWGCKFSDIGNRCDRNGCENMGYGAILLANAHDSWIRENYFYNLLNTDEDRSHIHAIYASDGSHEGAFANNRLENINGDPVRVRDGVTSMRFHKNCFVHAGLGAFMSDWFQNLEPSGQCIAPPSSTQQECPSYDLELKYNTFACLYDEDQSQGPALDFLLGDSCLPSSCTDQSEVRTSGNRRATCDPANACPQDMPFHW